MKSLKSFRIPDSEFAVTGFWTPKSLDCGMGKIVDSRFRTLLHGARSVLKRTIKAVAGKQTVVTQQIFLSVRYYLDEDIY